MVHLIMVKAGCVILPFILVILLGKNANGEISTGIISKLIRYYHNPVIVLINNYKNRAANTKSALRTSNVQPAVKDSKSKPVAKGGKSQPAAAGGKNKVLGAIKNNTKSAGYINDIIRSTGDKKKPIVKETQAKFEKAIRTRCETFGKCETKCKDPEKKENECFSLCQKLFDELDLCDKGKTTKEINVSTRAPPHSVEVSRNSCESDDDCKESKDECDESEDDCEKPKNDCDESDDDCNPKNECDESDDDCEPKDECDESDGICRR